MLSLSQTAGYAVMAMSYMDPEGQKMILVKDLAEQTGIPRPYLSKLLNHLTHTGLIKGKRGYKGGIILSRPASEITILEIADAVDGVEWRERCVLGLPGCGDRAPCPFHEFWGKEREIIARKLQELTLDQVVEFKNQGWRIWQSDKEIENYKETKSELNNESNHQENNS